MQYELPVCWLQLQHWLVHRPDFYDKEDRPGEADIIMAKHRNGPTETFHLAFLGATSKFKDMPQDYQQQQ